MSNFKYSEFVTFIKGDGLAKQNRFYIDMAIPSLKGPYATLWSHPESLKTMLMLCKGVSIPGVNVTTTELRTTGEVTNVPYDRNFGSATFTFYVDKQMYVRMMFDDWISSIQDPQTRTFGWYKDFISEYAEVFVLPKSETGAVYKIILNELMPKSIGNLSLDQSNNDIMTVDVTFDYRYYTTEMIEYVPATNSSGNIDTYTYQTPPQRTLPSGVQDTYRYVNTDKNRLPGSGMGTQDPSKLVPVNPVKALYDGYGAIAQAYTGNFQKFQSTFASGEVIYNGISVPLNINQALATIREQGLGTVKNKMVNSVFKKSGLKIKF